MLEGLIRVSASFEDWRGFLGRTLDQEQDPSNRFLLRYAQIRQLKEAADSETVSGLVSSFVQASTATGYYGDSEGRFFEALQWIGPGRELTSLRQAFGLANEPELCLALTQRLLRHVFEDQRANWSNNSVQFLNKDGRQPAHPGLTWMLLRSVAMLLLMKVFPFLFRRWLRRKSGSPAKGIKKLEYWGLEGNAPPLPSKVDDLQRGVLLSAADKTPLWEVKTNLWELFGLPDSAAALRQFVEERV